MHDIWLCTLHMIKNYVSRKLQVKIYLIKNIFFSFSRDPFIFPTKTYILPEMRIHKKWNCRFCDNGLGEARASFPFSTFLYGHVYIFRLKCWHVKKVQNQIFLHNSFPRFLEPGNYWKHVSPYCGDPSTFFKENLIYNRLKMEK